MNLKKSIRFVLLLLVVICSVKVDAQFKPIRADLPTPNSRISLPFFGVRHNDAHGTIGSLTAQATDASQPPVIDYFAPLGGWAYDTVSIYGANFTGVTEVYIANFYAEFTVENDNLISALVPEYRDGTGPVSVTGPGGTAYSTENFTIYTYGPIMTTTIDSFEPVSGRVGDTVDIYGMDITGVKNVAFNRMPAQIVGSEYGHITAVVPKGATTGKISIDAMYGPATSEDDFVVIPSTPPVGAIEIWGGSKLTPGEPNGFTYISADDLSTIGIERDGSIVGWGSNYVGMLMTPLPNSDFRMVASGCAHTVGLKKNGSVVCWGNNTSGLRNISAPNKDFISIDAGAYHNAGLKADGTIVCWGGNENQQCNVPSPNADFTAVSAGYSHTVALRKDGSVVCWGSNSMGQCSVPSPNADFVAVSAGLSYTVALRKDGSITGWGNNAYGQCSPPEPNVGFVAVSAGYYHTVALRGDGSVVVFGNNTYGQCDIPKPDGIYIAISAGSVHSVALGKDGSVQCWGGNDNNQCGVTPNDDFTLVKSRDHVTFGLKNDTIVCFGSNLGNRIHVPEPNQGFVEIGVGQGHAVGLRNDGSVVCWGDNSLGQLDIPLPNQDFVAIAVGAQHTLAVKRDGTVAGWGWNEYNQCDIPEPNRAFVAVAAGDAHSIGLKEDGSLAQWGYAYYCQQYPLPSPNSGYVAIAAGDYHSVGLKNDGSIVCWGWNGLGQCNVPEPNQDYIAVAAGYSHTMGLKCNGSIVCWGSNNEGQCNIPLPNSGFTAIAAGYNISLAIRSLYSISGNLHLDGYYGNQLPVELSATINTTGYPDITQCMSLNSRNVSDYQITTYLPPPYDVRIFGSHFLPIKAANVAGGNIPNFSLVNGDADGDGQINLFDFVVLDSNFGKSTPMADLNGDGQVNLFDYVVIDQNFGARGD